MTRATLVVLAISLSGCGAPVSGPPDLKASTSPEASPPAGGQTAATANPSIRLSIVDYAGIMQHIARNRGKVVVMDAWSTSCPPCLKEFHNLVELHRKYGPDRVACMSLSFDFEGLGKPEDQEPRVLDFLRAQGATFDNLMSNEESDVLYRKFKLAAVPAVFVYDRAGQLRKRFDNEQAKSNAEAFTYEQVGQLVAELLQEDAPDQGSGEAK